MKLHNKDKRERLLIIAAARLRSEGWKQNGIAVRLGISQPEVCRLLRDALEQDILSRGPALQNVSPEDYQAAHQQYFVKEDLLKMLQPLVPDGVRFDARVIAGTQDTFATEAAARVAELIPRAHRLGVNWGRTVAKICGGLAARWRSSASHRAPKVECIPLCGDPLFLMNAGHVEHSASHLAAQLGEILKTPRAQDMPSLSGVPAYISSERAGTSLTPLRQFLHSIPAYEEIFGSGSGDGQGRALVDGVDMIITGVGIIVTEKEENWRETGDLIKERLEQDRLSKEKLNQLIYGDIGGLLLARQHRDKEKLKTVTRLNAGWMGLQLSQLEDVVKRASGTKAPGVVVVAYGKWKAEMIEAIVRRGLVNELVVDWTLADALCTKISKN